MRVYFAAAIIEFLLGVSFALGDPVAVSEPR